MVALLAPYKGIVIQTLSDPLVKTNNPAERLFKRFGICQEWIESWDDINERSYFIFPGKDIQKWCRYAPTGTYVPHNRIIKYDWFTYIHRHALLEKDNNNSSLFEFNQIEKKYDVIYYGNSNRAGFREQQLRKYFPKETNNLLVGYKSDKINATQIDKIPHTELIEKISESKVSLVVGDLEHLDNVVTFRLYETLASDALAAIQIEYDPDKKLIQDPVLRELLYVKSSDDVKRLVESWNPDLLIRQKKELRRLLKPLDQQRLEFKKMLSEIFINNFETSY
jgi:hypothetical protein